MRRFRLLEDLQEKIGGEINAGYLGKKVEVLFEEKVKGRWQGRTPTNKLVFVESEEDLRGAGEAGDGDMDRAVVHAGETVNERGDCHVGHPSLRPGKRSSLAMTQGKSMHEEKISPIAICVCRDG